MQFLAAFTDELMKIAKDEVGAKTLHRMGGPGLGLGGACICSKCGHKMPHSTGKPCTEMTCPKCGERMGRAAPSS